MAIPGTVPVTGPIQTTAIGDTYPTHFSSRGKDDSAVDTFTDLALITAARRAEGMTRYVIDEMADYVLEADLTTWTLKTFNGVLPDDVMLKSTYDPNGDGSVINSDELGGEIPSYYLARANHTGTQAISATTGLQAALDAKINTSLIGNPNGVAPLDVTGLIPNAYLGFSLPLDPVIAWNPVTNTPTISDAGGAAGEIYIVYDSANPTVRDLGSGNISWNDGDAAIFDSGTSAFVKVAQIGVGVSQITTDAGVQTGAVTIDDTSYIAPSTDRNYVTDDIEDALNGADSPSATNVFVTQSVLANSIVVGNSVFMAELFADGQTLGDGTARLLNTLTSPATGLAYTNTSAGNAWPRVNSAFTMDVTAMTIDFVAIMESWLTMTALGNQSWNTPGGRGYVVNQSLIPPFDQTAIAAGRRSLSWGFNFNFSKLSGTSAFRLIDKYPVNQAQANGLQLDYSYHFSNGFLEGFDSAAEADCGIRLGGTTHSTMTNMKFYKFGISADWQFCLEPTWNNIKIEDYGLYGFRLGDGLWSGATINIAQSNIGTLNTVRCVAPGAKTPTAGMYFTGNSNIVTNQAAFEGGNGSVHHVLYDNELATTTKYNLVMRDSYFESAGASRAMVRVMANSGYYKMDGWTVQGDTANLPVLFEGESIGLPSADPLYIFLENNPAYMPEGGGYKLRNVAQDQKWTVNNVKLPNVASLTNASNWATDFGGTVPSSSMTRFLAPIA